MTYLYQKFHIFIPIDKNINNIELQKYYNEIYYSNYILYLISNDELDIEGHYIVRLSINKNINNTILDKIKDIPPNELIIVINQFQSILDERWLLDINNFFLNTKPKLLCDVTEKGFWITKSGVYKHIIKHYYDEKLCLREYCLQLCKSDIYIWDYNKSIFNKIESNINYAKIEPIVEQTHLLLATYERNKNIPLVLNMLQTQTQQNIHLHLLDNNIDVNIQKELDVILKPFYKKMQITLYRYNKNLHCFGRITIIKKIFQTHLIDYIIIFDDDQIYENTWLENMILKKRPLSTLSWYGKVFNECDYWKSTLWYSEIQNKTKTHIKEFSYFGPGGSIIDIQLFLFEELYNYEKYSKDIIAIDDIWMSFIFKKYLNIPFYRNITHPQSCIEWKNLKKMTWANIKEIKNNVFKNLSKTYQWDVTKINHNVSNINTYFDKIYVLCNNYTNLEKFQKQHICYKLLNYNDYTFNVLQIIKSKQKICVFHENFKFDDFFIYKSQKMIEKLSEEKKSLCFFNSDIKLVQSSDKIIYNENLIICSDNIE
jgi:hypothetical protein